jgi:hypothetical protein
LGIANATVSHSRSVGRSDCEASVNSVSRLRSFCQFQTQYSTVSHIGNIDRSEREASDNFIKKNLKFGWTPPHVAIFLEKKLAKKFLYKEKYEISSDYDFIIRLFNNNEVLPLYISNFY